MPTPSRPRLVGALVTAGVIVSISRDDLTGSWWWAGPFVVLVAIALTLALPVDQRILPPGWVPGLLVAATAASYACVPETDHFGWIAVVPIVMAVLELWLDRPLPFAAIYVGVAVVMWAGIYGATGRESALVGALFAWFPALVIPAIGPFTSRLRRPRPIALMLLVFPPIAATAIVARTGALQPTIGPALTSVALAIPAAVAASAILLVLLIDRSLPRPARGHLAG